MIYLLIHLVIGAVVGVGAYAIACLIVNRAITHFGSIRTEAFDLQGALQPRYFAVGALVGVLCYGAVYVGPLKAGGYQRAYNDLCLTLHPQSLTEVIGDNYADDITGQYLDTSFDDNCRWASYPDGAL